MRRSWMLIGVVAAALSACDSGQSAVETRDRRAEAPGEAIPAPEAPRVDTAIPAAASPITANRREDVDAKAQRLFERNGAAFGARSTEDYLAQVRAFTTRPPRDAETARRPNGDTLIYQASTNTFAVVARDGTARTMFKPDEGAAYWAEQKARAPTFGQRRATAE